MWWPGELHGKKGLFATEHVESFNQENYHSLCEFLEEQFSGEELTQLRTLAVRQVESFPDSAGMLWECVQCPHLTELDLKGCHLVELCDELQFWAVPHLTVLNLTNTQLPYLPASVGRLKQLHTLLLSGNALTTLPSTLSFCFSLTTLDLRNNNFSILPAVIFRIESLALLRRHGNYDMRRVIAELAASTRRDKYVTVVPERIPLLSSSGEHQVVPLRLLAVRAVMTERLDYWARSEVAPALCRVLDNSQMEYKICDNCCSAQPLNKRGFRIRWLVESYLGLKHIPFEHFACSTECACTLNDNFQKIQSKLKREHDQEYQSMLDQYSSSDTSGRSRAHSFLRKRRKELEVQETWSTDFGGQWSGGVAVQRRRAWSTTGRGVSHHHRVPQYHHHSASRSSRTSCSVM
jgi:Leucine-rich repeat (LRR) protein